MIMNILKQIINNISSRIIYRNSNFGISGEFEIIQKENSFQKEFRDWSITHGKFDKIQYKGKGERVAVLDTGIDINHNDLSGQVNGFSFIKDDSDFSDFSSHGTFCAGEIVAKENLQGVIGIAPEATCFCGKVLYGNNRDNRIYNFEQSLSQAILAAPKEGCGVISMSLGTSYKSLMIENAINEVVSKGVIVIAALGNDGMKGTLYKSYPAYYENCIAVASSNEKDLPTWFSSIGLEHGKPDVAISSLEYYWGCIPDNKYGKMIGTCLAGNTMVLTDKGPVPIIDVKKGNNVYSYDFENRKMSIKKCTNWFDRGKKKTYRIKTNNFTIEATDNHPFLCAEPQDFSSRRKSSKSRVMKWKKLSDLKLGDLIANYYSLPSKAKTVTANGITITKNLCQLVGLFIGDGYIVHDRRRSEKPYGISFCMFDLCLQYKSFIKKELGKEPHEYNGQLTIYSVEIGNMFRMLELDKTSYTKRIPSWAWELPIEYKKHLLAGLIDSDGTVSAPGRISFEFCNKELTEDIKYFCQSMGYHVSNIYERTRNDIWSSVPSRKHYKQKLFTTSYHISITSYDSIPFLDTKYNASFQKGINNSFGKRIYETICLSDDIELDRILSIEEFKEQNVYDIEVEGSHNFIANGLIVHNSMACPTVAGIALLWREAIKEKKIEINSSNMHQEFKKWLHRVANDTNKNGWDCELGFGVLMFENGDLKIC